MRKDNTRLDANKLPLNKSGSWCKPIVFHKEKILSLTKLNPNAKLSTILEAELKLI